MKITRNESYYKAFPVMTGEMVEWFKAAVLKTAEVQASGGSNPSLSAILFPIVNGSVRESYTC